MAHDSRKWTLVHSITRGTPMSTDSDLAEFDDRAAAVQYLDDCKVFYRNAGYLIVGATLYAPDGSRESLPVQ